jgi:L-fuculose-phosphate aldolase
MHDAGELLSTAQALYELMRYGKKMVARGLVSAHAGNLSTRLGKPLLISTHGSMLDALKGKIVQVALDAPSAVDHLASSELPMHRAIYRQTEAMAVCHGHGPFSILESLRTEATHVIPADSKAALYLPIIPIVEGPAGSEPLGQATALALTAHRGALIRGHGVVDQRGECGRSLCNPRGHRAGLPHPLPSGLGAGARSARLSPGIGEVAKSGGCGNSSLTRATC